MTIIRRLIQLAVIIPAVLCLLWACWVTPSAGTLVGVVLFGGIIVVTLLYRQVIALVKRLWEKKLGKAAVSVAAVVAAAAVVVLTFFNIQMALHVSQPVNDLNCVIVLGCRVKGETPSSMMWVRTRAAYDALCEHPDAVCIVSGGQGDGEYITEAEAMRRLLREWGVPDSRIILEDRSTSTQENLDNSAKILDELGITDGIAIATSEYHQYRASIYAKRSGLGDVGHYSAGTSRYWIMNCWLREWVALAAAIFLGY